MKRSTERILTTHVGSLPRPPAFLEMIFERDDGRMTDEARWNEAADQAVREAVKTQLAAGLDVVNDGEVTKVGYSTYMRDRLTGFEGQSQPAGPADLMDYPEYMQAMFSQPSMANYMRLKTPACNGPVTLRDPGAIQRDIQRFQAALHDQQPEDAFMTAASPGVIALFMRNEYYATYEEYLFAVADAMKHEYRSIVEAGLVLQLDCPDLAMGRHIQFANAPLEEFRKNAQLHVEALNAALEGLPAEQIRMHLCWGNYEGPHHRDVPFKDIADVVFKAKPSAILVEAANPRHEHEWAVFETMKLPEGKTIVPGVIDSTSNFIEHPELVAQRIVRYARLVGRENVMAGVDCGFGTFAGVGLVDPKIVWAKLGALAEGARIASQQLW